MHGRSGAPRTAQLRALGEILDTTGGSALGGCRGRLPLVRVTCLFLGLKFSAEGLVQRVVGVKGGVGAWDAAGGW